MKEKHLLNIKVKAEHTTKNRDVTVWCEIERSADSIILQTNGNGKGTFPLLLKEDIEAAGIQVEPNIPFDDCSEEVQNIALRLDDPRIIWGFIHDNEREDILMWLRGELDDPNNGSKVRAAKRETERKEERNRQDAFLKEKGYRWEKRSVYLWGPGDPADGWFLISPEGEVAIGSKPSADGEEVVQDGNLTELLTSLGYWGQEGIEAAAYEKEKAAEWKAMRESVSSYFANDANRTGETFEDAQSEFTTSPIYLESHYPRRRFRIESDCLWHESHNISDGDNWSYNNCDYGIAAQYKYDETIAEYLKQLAK